MSIWSYWRCHLTKLKRIKKTPVLLLLKTEILFHTVDEEKRLTFRWNSCVYNNYWSMYVRTMTVTLKWCLSLSVSYFIYLVVTHELNIRYSLINMRQLQILSNSLPVLAWCDYKIVLQIKTKQFYDHIMEELVKTGKFS